MKKYIILSGCGDGIVVASAFKDMRNNNEDLIPMRFLNDYGSLNETIDGLPVLGKIKDTEKFLYQKDEFFISALLNVKESSKRAKNAKA